MSRLKWTEGLEFFLKVLEKHKVNNYDHSVINDITVVVNLNFNKINFSLLFLKPMLEVKRLNYLHTLYAEKC